MKLWPLVSALFVCLALFLGTSLAQSIPRGNELSLAQIQPGKDTLETAKKRMREGYRLTIDGKPEEKVFRWAIWLDACAHASMEAELDKKGVVQSVAVFVASWMVDDCFERAPKPPVYSRWMTGRGVRLWHHKSRVVGLYGDPDKTEITKEGNERLLFLFDGVDGGQPKALEVVCTRGLVTRIVLYSKNSLLLADLKLERNRP